MECPKCKTDNPSDSKFCKECATPLPSPKEIPVTETLETPKEELTTGSLFAGRYQIIEELGKGGMGKVYRVLDKELNEEVALKLIKPEIAADKKIIERFKNELKLARKIGHRNVGRMYELLEHKGSHYITMEYVSGQDLKGLIRQSGQLATGTTISLAKQVCEGLAEAHRLGVIHRDLKPSNIMIDREGNARIMDFGIARSIKGKGITGAGVMVGTPEYMSPEQVEGKDADQRSDVYSLGIILYEMVTGRVPFEGDTPLSVAVKHKTEAPPDPRQINTQIPEDLSRLILRCMEKDKEKRYQSTGEILSELENIEKGIPTTEKLIPKRKPITSKEITVTIGLKKLFVPALVAVVLIIAALVMLKLLPRKEAVPTPSDKPLLAVMYFKNNTGDEGLDHWRTMLSNLLIADLTQSKHIRVLSEDKLFNILSQLDQTDAETYSSEVLKNVAAEAEATHILQGAYAKAGDEIRINIILQDTNTGESIGSELVEGKGEENIFSMVDELTRKIKASFQLTEEQIASDIDIPVRNITTSSPEALRYYSLGMKLKREGELRKGIEFLERAVAIDPEFAMAYRAIAVSYGGLGNRAKRKEYLQKAFKLVDRLPDRERYVIEGDFYGLSEKTWGKSIEIYEKLLGIYPDANIARNNLAVKYFVLEEWQKAIEHYELSVKYKNVFWGVYAILAWLYDKFGLHDKAREVSEAYLNIFPLDIRMHRSRAEDYRYQGKYELAHEVLDEAFAIDPTDWRNNRERGDIYFCMGDFIKAEAEYRKLLEKEEQHAHFWGMKRLANLFVLKGRFEESYDFAQRGLELAEEIGNNRWRMSQMFDLAYLDRRIGRPEDALKKLDIIWKSAVEDEFFGEQVSALYVKGRANQEMNQTAEAQRTAEALKELIEQGLNKNLMRHYYKLMGMREIERKDYSKAIEYLKKGLPLLRDWDQKFIRYHIGYADSLGKAYYESGDLERAQEEYGRITTLSIDRIEYGDIYAKSFYRLGQISEQQGDTAKAIENYEKFLDLWKDADPGFAEVEDAKTRLEALK